MVSNYNPMQFFNKVIDKITILCIILCTIFHYVNLLGQNRHTGSSETQRKISIIDAKIEEIYNTPLRIIGYDYWNNNYSGGITKYKTFNKKKGYIVRESEIEESIGHLFFDKNNRLRIYISLSLLQDCNRFVSFFDSNGDILLHLFYSSNHSSCSGYGKIYYWDKKVIKFDAYNDCCSGSKIQGDLVYCKKIPGDDYFKIIVKAEEILKDHIIPTFTSNIKFYKASTPKPGDISFINANDVFVRSKPSKDGIILIKLNVLYMVKILQIDRKESIAPWGTNPWYKISYNNPFTGQKNVGYVFGAFVSKIL